MVYIVYSRYTHRYIVSKLLFLSPVREPSQQIVKLKGSGDHRSL